MHTQEVPEPYQWLVRLGLLWHLPLWRRGALAGANVLQSDNGARTKRLPKNLGGNERYHRTL